MEIDSELEGFERAVDDRVPGRRLVDVERLEKRHAIPVEGLLVLVSDDAVIVEHDGERTRIAADHERGE